MHAPCVVLPVRRQAAYATDVPTCSHLTDLALLTVGLRARLCSAASQRAAACTCVCCAALMPACLAPSPAAVPLKGAERRGLVSLEAKKRHGEGPAGAANGAFTQHAQAAKPFCPPGMASPKLVASAAPISPVPSRTVAARRSTLPAPLRAAECFGRTSVHLASSAMPPTGGWRMRSAPQASCASSCWRWTCPAPRAGSSASTWRGGRRFTSGAACWACCAIHSSG